MSRKPLIFLSNFNFFEQVGSFFFEKPVFHFKPSEASFIGIRCLGSQNSGIPELWDPRILGIPEFWDPRPVLAGNGLRSRCFVRGVLKKVKKTSRESAVQAQNDNPYNENSVLGTHPRIPRIHRIPRIRCQQLQVRPSFYTRRGPG